MSFLRIYYEFLFISFVTGCTLIDNLSLTKTIPIGKNTPGLCYTFCRNRNNIAGISGDKVSLYFRFLNKNGTVNEYGFVRSLVNVDIGT